MMNYMNRDLGLLLIRLGLATIFIYHGWGKFSNLEGTTAFFASLGLSVYFPYLVATVELLGGLAMLVGIKARLAGALLAVVMVFAIYLVKWAKGFGGYEFDFMLLLSSLGIFFAGSGRYTVRMLMGQNQTQ